jgi:hypothetical protein
MVLDFRAKDLLNEPMERFPVQDQIFWFNKILFSGENAYDIISHV